MPVRGLRRLRSTSTASALSGDTYSTRQRLWGSAGGGVEVSWSSAARNAARVLPEPVGATTSTSEPSPMARHAPAWAAVGAEKAPVNQPLVAGEKPSRARCAELTMRPSCTSALTIGLTCGFVSDGGVDGGRCGSWTGMRRRPRTRWVVGSGPGRPLWADIPARPFRRWAAAGVRGGAPQPPYLRSWSQPTGRPYAFRVRSASTVTIGRASRAVPGAHARHRMGQPPSSRCSLGEEVQGACHLLVREPRARE